MADAAPPSLDATSYLPLLGGDLLPKEPCADGGECDACAPAPACCDPVTPACPWAKVTVTFADLPACAAGLNGLPLTLCLVGGGPGAYPTVRSGIYVGCFGALAVTLEFTVSNTGGTQATLRVVTPDADLDGGDPFGANARFHFVATVTAFDPDTGGFTFAAQDPVDEASWDGCDRSSGF